MQRLHAGLLHDPSAPCPSCNAPGGTCWCGTPVRNPRHDEGVFAGLLARSLGTRAA